MEVVLLGRGALLAGGHPVSWTVFLTRGYPVRWRASSYVVGVLSARVCPVK